MLSVSASLGGPADIFVADTRDDVTHMTLLMPTPPLPMAMRSAGDIEARETSSSSSSSSSSLEYDATSDALHCVCGGNCDSSGCPSDVGEGGEEREVGDGGDDDDGVTSSEFSVGDGGKRGMNWNPRFSFRCGDVGDRLEPEGALLRRGCGNSESFNGDGAR